MNTLVNIGTMPTAKGFTGQRADVTTGLDYYGARYYDPQAGQFASTDSKADGLSPYAYVRGNPETATDPSGHSYCAATHCSPSGGNGATACDRACFCAGQGVYCGQIYNAFQDNRTRRLLLALAMTSVGLQFLPFLLYIGGKVGDAFIQWDLTDPHQYGYT